MAALIGIQSATGAECIAGTRDDVAVTPLGLSAVGTALPSQTGNSGKFLSTDGTSASWATPSGSSLPSQTGNSGKYLKTDGTSATWQTASGGSGVTLGYAFTETGAVATGTTQIPRDDTIPQSTEGDQYMSVSYTPTSATSKLRIDVVAQSANTSFLSVCVALFKDSDANALACMPYDYPGTNYMMTTSLTHWMTSGTTSAITFKVRIGVSGAGTTTFNGVSGARKYGGATASSITVTEYA